MKPKDAVYAAVGAPIVTARAINARLENLRGELGSRTEGLNERAHHILEEWTHQGRQTMEKVSDGKMVDELAARMDFDQAREQVGRLREQLEEMLATWRTSFRPETGEDASIQPVAPSTAPAANTGVAGMAPAASSDTTSETEIPRPPAESSGTEPEDQDSDATS